jgi:hypothetical protein
LTSHYECRLRMMTSLEGQFEQTKLKLLQSEEELQSVQLRNGELERELKKQDAAIQKMRYDGPRGRFLKNSVQELAITITIAITNCNPLTSDVGGSLLPRLSEYIIYAAYGSILHPIFCHKLMVARWSISEENYLSSEKARSNLYIPLLKNIHNFKGPRLFESGLIFRHEEAAKAAQLMQAVKAFVGES